MKDIGKLREYLNNKKPAPLELYAEYKDKINKIRSLKIHVICSKCSKNEDINYDLLQSRKETLCSKCYKTKISEYKKIIKIPQELRGYVNNKIPIPFNIFLKYKDIYNGPNDGQQHILVNCKRCNKKVEMTWIRLRNRKKFINEEICYNCVSIIGTQKHLNIPVELQFKGSKDNPILWEHYLKYKDIYSNGCKKWIKIQCTECNQEKIIQWRKVRNRTYSKDLAICGTCIQKYKANLPEVKKINSEAQKIAQNRPEVLEKHRKSQLFKMKNDEEYRKKKMRPKSTLEGYFRNIKFDSSWELSFIIYYYGKIERCDFEIPYMYNNNFHYYYPDFIVNLNNKKIIYEIKGYTTERVEAKVKGAIEYIKDSEFDEYNILYYEDLNNLPDFVFYDTYEKIQVLDKSELIITHYPKSWIVNNNI